MSRALAVSLASAGLTRANETHREVDMSKRGTGRGDVAVENHHPGHVQLHGGKAELVIPPRSHLP